MAPAVCWLRFGATRSFLALPQTSQCSNGCALLSGDDLYDTVEAACKLPDNIDYRILLSGRSIRRDATLRIREASSLTSRVSDEYASSIGLCEVCLAASLGSPTLTLQVDGPPPTLEVVGRLRGGKGGFGSLLRGQKGGRKKTKNFDACRDLSGRRLRHVQAADRIAKWLEKKKGDDELVAALGGDPTASSSSTLKAITPEHSRAAGSSAFPATETDPESYVDALGAVATLTEGAVAAAFETSRSKDTAATVLQGVSVVSKEAKVDRLNRLFSADDTESYDGEEEEEED